MLSGFALSLAVFTALEETRREALVIGLVYFVIYLLTSYASRQAYYFSKRFENLSRAVNITFLAGIGFLIAAGLMAAIDLELVAVFCFIIMFLLNNVRRPINVGIISDQISSRVMASGLSTETLATTIFSALFAPLLGFLVDEFGVGVGLSLLGLVLIPLFFMVKVEEAEKQLPPK
jgi:hypothetical protein